VAGLESDPGRPCQRGYEERLAGKSKNLRDCRHTPTVALTSRLRQLSALGQSVWIDYLPGDLSARVLSRDPSGIDSCV
jgi:hypothetical protein